MNSLWIMPVYVCPNFICAARTHTHTRARTHTHTHTHTNEDACKRARLNETARASKRIVAAYQHDVPARYCAREPFKQQRSNKVVELPFQEVVLGIVPRVVVAGRIKRHGRLINCVSSSTWLFVA
jgi:hypothetical protein